MKSAEFEPKIITVLREGYSFAAFGKDLLAGLIVGIVALPLSIAIAIASGARPEQGLITAFIGGLVIALLSGSRVQIGGPTGAFIIILFSIGHKYGPEGLAAATVMAGILLVLMGFMRLGDVIKYIPYPVTIGFTSGIALVIFSTQMPDFFGFTLAHPPENFIDKWHAYIINIGHGNLFAVGLAVVTILIIQMWPRITQRVPGTLIAIIVTTGLTQLLHLPVATIASRFGTIPGTFPMPMSIR